MGEKLNQKIIDRYRRQAILALSTSNAENYNLKIEKSKNKVESLESKKFDLEQKLMSSQDIQNALILDYEGIEKLKRNCDALGTVAGTIALLLASQEGYSTKSLIALGTMGGLAVAPALAIADQKHNIIGRAISGTSKYFLKKQLAHTESALNKAQAHNYALRQALELECDIEDPYDIDHKEFERDWEKGL